MYVGADAVFAAVVDGAQIDRRFEVTRVIAPNRVLAIDLETKSLESLYVDEVKPIDDSVIAVVQIEFVPFQCPHLYVVSSSWFATTTYPRPA